MCDLDLNHKGVKPVEARPHYPKSSFGSSANARISSFFSVSCPGSMKQKNHPKINLGWFFYIQFENLAFDSSCCSSVSSVSQPVFGSFFVAKKQVKKYDRYAGGVLK